MGQKTNPVGFRLGVIRTWGSRWFARKEYADWLLEDQKTRRYIRHRLRKAGIAAIEIERAPKKVSINIHAARPGMVIGRKGSEVDKLRDELRKLTGKDIYLNIIEVKKPESWYGTSSSQPMTTTSPRSCAAIAMFTGTSVTSTWPDVTAASALARLCIGMVRTAV